MNDTGFRGVAWKKSRRSQNNGGCVEIGLGGSLGADVGIRDTKYVEGGALVVSREAFGAFLRQAKAGELG